MCQLNWCILAHLIVHLIYEDLYYEDLGYHLGVCKDLPCVNIFTDMA